MRYLIGCDFGGGSSKATLLSEDGRVAAVSTREYSTDYPRPGWAEQNPDDSYDALVRNVRSLLRDSGVSPDEIHALALDGATHTAVLLDENDTPVRPAIYWTDRRSAPQAEELRQRHQAEIAGLSFNSPSSLWTLPQLMWLRENEPEHFGRIRKLLSIKDYVRWRLTGDYVTDSIEAMGFMLLDARRNEWSPFLCGLCGLDPSILPAVVSPAQTLSPLTRKACGDLGLSRSTAVIAGATDTAMEVYAAGAVQRGQATVKLATAGRICSVTDRAVAHPNLVCYRHVIEGAWYPGTATKSCASANRWYRDTLSRHEKEVEGRTGKDAYEILSDEAALVPPGSEGLFFHPYLQGEITPYRDDRLRASFTGIGAYHTKAHFNRAVLEGISYSMKDCYEFMREIGIAPSAAVLIGGGAKSALWRQMMADMLGIPLLQTENTDSSLGSAMLAGVATGIFPSHAEAIRACVRVVGEVRPDEAARDFYHGRFATYRRIQAALAPVYHGM